LESKRKQFLILPEMFQLHIKIPLANTCKWIPCSDFAYII